MYYHWFFRILRGISRFLWLLVSGLSLKEEIKSHNLSAKIYGYSFLKLLLFVPGQGRSHSHVECDKKISIEIIMLWFLTLLRLGHNDQRGHIARQNVYIEAPNFRSFPKILYQIFWRIFFSPPWWRKPAWPQSSYSLKSRSRVNQSLIIHLEATWNLKHHVKKIFMQVEKSPTN